MLSTSWKATGKIRPLWLSLAEPKTYKREALAELTGIPASNLSAMNTGEMPLTPEMARRLIDATEGFSLLDLGAPEEEAPDDVRSIGQRLDELEDKALHVADLEPVWRALRHLAIGETDEALRVLSEVAAGQ